MRTRTVLAVVAVGTLVGAGAAVALDRAGRAPVDPQPVTSASMSWRTGPTADYDGDSGGIGEVRPLHLAVPDDAARYDAVVEVALTYRTRFGGAPEVEVYVRDGNVEPGDDGPIDYLPTVPRRAVPLAPAAPDGTTVTARFLAPDLEGGSEVSILPSVNAARTGPDDRFVVRTSDVVLTVDLTPAA